MNKLRGFPFHGAMTIEEIGNAAAMCIEAANCLEEQHKRLVRLEFELTARDINDMAASEAMEQVAEAVRVLERRMMKRRKAT